MTTSAVIATPAHAMEYFVCIEGLGWPVDEETIASGFDGTIFCTEYDSAAALAGTYKRGLMLPGSISDSIDPLRATYQSGGMQFKIVDDGFLLLNFAPHKTHNKTTINTALVYGATSVVLADGANFATGDTAWVGGREAIKLGTKSGGGAPHTYTGSTRGYLGTRRGRVDFELTTATGLAWPVGADVLTINRLWHDRRVRLYAHVPGEAASGISLFWSGRLRDAQVEDNAQLWVFDCVSDDLGVVSQSITPPSIGWILTDLYLGMLGEMYTPYLGDEIYAINNAIDRGCKVARTITDVDLTNSEFGLAGFYCYRTEPGGTVGMRAASASGGGTPQARAIGDVTYAIGGYMQLGETIVYPVVGKFRPATAGGTELTYGYLDVVDDLGGFTSGAPEIGAPVRFLLDNITDDYRLSRFSSNRQIFDNPIDILLCFLTSMPDEFYLADATGGTTSVPTFAAGVGATDLWKGYALFCVEGDNKDYARKITANTDTSITVERAFDNAVAVGTEYQVRNSIYDTLPIGWGLGLHNSKIDIGSFEALRDKFMGDARVGRWLLGNKPKVELWNLLLKNICEPYGVLLYFNRSNGKLSAKSITESLGNGLVETYVALDTSNIISISDLEYRMSKPVGAINLKMMATHRTWVEGGQEVVVRIQDPQLKSAYGPNGLAEIDMSAMFHSIHELPELAPRMISKLKDNVVPGPEIGVDLALKEVVNIQAGTYVLITVADWPVNPFTVTRGYGSVPGLVLSTAIDIGRGVMRATIRLLSPLTSAKIAPAAVTTSKGSDVNGAFFVVQDNNYVNDPDLDKDWYHFAVTDRLRLYDRFGARSGTETYVITAFGSNQSSTPAGASDSRIYVDVAITPAIGTGDYVSFEPYSANRTTRMSSYSALAAASTSTTLSGGDAVKVYA